MKMKKILLTALILSLISSQLNAQTYQTQMLQDDPTKVLDRFIVVDVLSADIDLDFVSSNLYFGASAYWPLTEKLIIDANIKLPYFQIGNKGFGITLEPGVYFKLVSKNKTDDVPVVIESELYADEIEKNGETYYVDTYKFLNTTGTYTNSYGARGGLYVRQGPFETINYFDGTTANSTLAGVYVGFQKVTQAFVELLVSGNGLKDEKFIGAGFTKMYFDIMFLPVRNITDAPTFADNERDRPFGFRAGFQWNKFPYDASIFHRIVYTGEIGIRPLTGFYLTGGMGFKVFQD